MIYRILLAEDDIMQREILTNILQDKFGYKVIAVSNGHEAVNQMKSYAEINAILLDISMPIMNGFEALEQIKNLRSDIPVIMLTATDDINIAVKAIKNGASDFILKPPNPEQLNISISNAIKIATLSKELQRLKRDKEGALLFSDLIGWDSSLSDTVNYGRKAANSDLPVLIIGETGTGKELLARAIHGESKRVGAPFIAINCGAIAENLVESILFGHEKGAFTGAIMRTIGKFREAEGGTIFLDEIGELPLEAQVKLLRILQQKEVEPVGAGRPVKVNVRVVSATNRDLKIAVKEGRFRDDLYFRLNVLPINVLPLRERRQDIILLAKYFMENFSSVNALNNKIFTKEAERYLEEYSWPGNVRELENLIHRLLVLSENNKIDLADILELHDRGIDQEEKGYGLSIKMRKNDGSFKKIYEIEDEAMNLAMKHQNGNITMAAEILGIAKSTFYRKMSKKNK